MGPEVSRWLWVAVVASVSAGAAAQPGRTNRVVCAEEAPICAAANVQRDETAVERFDRSTRTNQTLWKVPRWLNIVRLADTGDELLVEAQPTLEVHTALPEAAVLLAVYRRGELARVFTVAEVFSQPGELELLRRAPAWARRLPSPEPDVARYLLATGRTVRLSLSTATLASE